VKVPSSARRDEIAAGTKSQRAFVLDRAKMQLDETKRTIEVSFSSEEPVERYWGTEILDHSSAASCDLSRLKAAGPLLMDHNTRDQIGVVEKCWIDTEGRQGRAILRFSKNARAQEIWTDVLDGIRRNVSVDYTLNKIFLESEADGKRVYRIKKWTPDEISIVSVPADTSVGVGRADDPTSQTQPTNPPILAMNRARIIAALNRAGIPFDPTATDEQLAALLEANLAAAGAQRAGAQGAASTPAAIPTSGQRGLEITNEERSRITGSAAKAERDRINQIQSLYHQHRCGEVDKDGKVLEGFLTDGEKSVADLQNWILQNRYKAKPIELDPNIGMSNGEIKQYSLVRVLNRLANKMPLDGLELEASRAVAEKVRREPQGFFIPHDVASRGFAESKGLDRATAMRLALSIAALGESRALTAGVATAGGYTVGTEVLTGSLIELLRNKALVTQLGAQNLSGLIGDISIPRHTGGATTYWLDETSTVTLSQQSFGQLALTPHRLAAATAYSKQLLQQASIDIEGFVRADLMKVLGIEKDRAAINGLNAAGEPLGILNTTGVGSVTFGAAATWAKILDFETQVANANADMGVLAYLTTPASRAKWKAATKIAASQYSDFLWEKGNAPGSGIVNSYRAEATLQVPTNRVIFGNWNDFIIADWDGIDVVVDPYSLATAGQIQIVVMILTDNGMRHVGSFCVSSDSGAQ
jgi:HK97 family phage major capsid protein